MGDESRCSSCRIHGPQCLACAWKDRALADNATIARLRSELSRVTAMLPSEWRNMSTAPQDGSPVLLFMGNRRDKNPEYLVCAFNVAHDAWYGPRGYVYPLCWMPLPDAPMDRIESEATP